MCWAAQPPQLPNQRTEWRGSLGARAQNLDRLGSPSRKPHARLFAGQGAGDGCAALRDAVAAARRGRRSTGLRPFQPWRAAARNSLAPAPPSTGEGMRPMRVQPCAAMHAPTSSQARCERLFASDPALDDLGPADLELRLDQADEPGGPRRELEDMRQHEPLRNEAHVADDRARRLRRSAPPLWRARRRLRTIGRAGRPRGAGRTARGRRRLRRPWPRRACSRTSVKPPVEAPTSRQTSPAGSSPKASSAAASFNPPRET